MDIEGKYTAKGSSAHCSLHVLAQCRAQPRLAAVSHLAASPQSPATGEICVHQALAGWLEVARGWHRSIWHQAEGKVWLGDKGWTNK